jgi:hypothetical protein
MTELRDLLFKATKEEVYIADVASYLENNEEQPPFASYRAMLIFLKANYINNPFKKLNTFNKARNKMEKAVELNPNDIETRFLRISIQTKIPSFLDYNKNKEEDKSFIVKHSKEMADENLKSLILEFFRENQLLTQEEYKQL